MTGSSLADTIHLETVCETLTKHRKDLIVTFKKQDTISTHNLTKTILDLFNDHMEDKNSKYVFKSYQRMVEMARPIADDDPQDSEMPTAVMQYTNEI